MGNEFHDFACRNSHHHSILQYVSGFYLPWQTLSEVTTQQKPSSLQDHSCQFRRMVDLRIAASAVRSLGCLALSPQCTLCSDSSTENLSSLM